MEFVIFEALSEIDPVLRIVLHRTEVVQLGVVGGSGDLHERPRSTITNEHYICEAGESLQAALQRRKIIIDVNGHIQFNGHKKIQ